VVIRSECTLGSLRKTLQFIRKQLCHPPPLLARAPLNSSVETHRSEHVSVHRSAGLNLVVALRECRANWVVPACSCDTSEIATSGIAWFDWHGEANGLRINEIGAILTHRAVTAAKIIGVAIVIVVAAELHDSNTGLNRGGSV